MRLNVVVVAVSLAILVVCTTTEAQRPNWSCSTNATGFNFDLEKLSGVWYEAARIPKVQVTECLNVTVPSEITDDNQYALRLEYYSTVNNQWAPRHETVEFPWDDNTQNGVFKLVYNSSISKVTVTFKLMFTDYNNIALVCGYAGISPIPLFKLMTRQRELNPQIIKEVQKYADRYDVGPQIVWEEQSLEKCSASNRILPSCTVFSIFLIMFLRHFSSSVNYIYSSIMN